MENHFPFKKYAPIESMMLQIKDDGEKNTWEWIETIKNPLNRIYQRKLFFLAKDKLRKEK